MEPDVFGSTDPVGPDADLSHYHPQGQGQAVSPPDPVSDFTDTPAVCEPTIRNARIVQLPPDRGVQDARPGQPYSILYETPVPLDRGLWRYWGITLPTAEGGTVELGELNEFVAWVRNHMPDAVIRVHKYGLRAYTLEGTDNGPHLDWRDWD